LEANWIDIPEKKDFFLSGDGLPVDSNRDDIISVTDHHVPRYFYDRANADDAIDSVSDRVITTGA
jgi:hypothetical protein